MRAPTGEWKVNLAGVLFGVSVALLIYKFIITDIGKSVK
jgi:hypothetical protein